MASRAEGNEWGSFVPAYDPRLTHSPKTRGKATLQNVMSPEAAVQTGAVDKPLLERCYSRLVAFVQVRAKRNYMSRSIDGGPMRALSTQAVETPFLTLSQPYV